MTVTGVVRATRALLFAVFAEESVRAERAFVAMSVGALALARARPAVVALTEIVANDRIRTRFGVARAAEALLTEVSGEAFNAQAGGIGIAAVIQREGGVANAFAAAQNAFITGAVTTADVAV